MDISFGGSTIKPLQFSIKLYNFPQAFSVISNIKKLGFGNFHVHTYLEQHFSKYIPKETCSKRCSMSKQFLGHIMSESIAYY